MYIEFVAGESITKLTDLDNLVQFYVTPEYYVERTNDALMEWGKMQEPSHFIANNNLFIDTNSAIFANSPNRGV